MQRFLDELFRQQSVCIDPSVNAIIINDHEWLSVDAFHGLMKAMGTHRFLTQSMVNIIDEFIKSCRK